MHPAYHCDYRIHEILALYNAFTHVCIFATKITAKGVEVVSYVK